MKTKILSAAPFLSAALATSLMAGSPAFAASKLMKACKHDFKKFGCSVKTDAEAYDCLEKHEKEGQKNEGLSAACHKAHESYEKKTGKVEANEEHPESAEKSE